MWHLLITSLDFEPSKNASFEPEDNFFAPHPRNVLVYTQQGILYFNIKKVNNYRHCLNIRLKSNKV